MESTLIICITIVVVITICCTYSYKIKRIDLKAKSEENSYKKDILEIQTIIESMNRSCVQQTKESLQGIINDIKNVIY